MSSHAETPRRPIGESPLRRLRRQRKLSLEGLAREAGVSVATVYRAEHGRHETREETWRAIATALGVPLDSLHGQEADSASTGRGENPNDGAGRDLLAETTAAGAERG
ncbi:helix-turn-helix domain-containing protein [Miltoncostaea marina]|uniref:helix-turn-helix domain-containing protein n=1 Tax=Miltoncostaea marina TaxID=2843215 RepID=UPI001C3D9071|nr:helix-turn-helix transcriptional regulator [Miltoncostaea marina]